MSTQAKCILCIRLKKLLAILEQALLQNDYPEVGFRVLGRRLNNINVLLFQDRNGEKLEKELMNGLEHFMEHADAEESMRSRALLLLNALWKRCDLDRVHFCHRFVAA